MCDLDNTVYMTSSKMKRCLFKPILVICGLCICFIILYTTNMDGTLMDFRSTRKVYCSFMPCPPPVTTPPTIQLQPGASEDEHGIMTERLTRLHQVCSDPKRTQSYKISKTQSQQMYHESSTLNMSFCLIPKAGSTFMKASFLVIEKDYSLEKAITLPAASVQALIVKQRNVYKETLNNGVVFTRDPFSRLYSGFIDRYFLLRYFSQAESLAKLYGKGCRMTIAGQSGYNITFQDFLDFVTKRALAGKAIDAHWAPVYILCGVCVAEYKYIVQQETLIPDMKAIFNQNIRNTSKLKILNKLFRSSSTGQTLIGLIKSLWNRHRLSRSHNCCNNSLAFCVTVWEGLQIQGYIRDNVSFPRHKFKGDHHLTSDQLTDVVFETMATYPMSSSDRKAQRHRALVKAYADVPKKTIYKIQEMFKMDFEIFGYDKNKPKLVF